MKQNYDFVTLESEMGAVCLESVDAGRTNLFSRFHLYFMKGDLRTLCGINLHTALNMIDQDIQGKLKDAKVSCRRCDKVLQKLRSKLQNQTEVSRK